jgi:hypothetical protein
MAFFSVNHECFVKGNTIMFYLYHDRYRIYEATSFNKILYIFNLVQAKYPDEAFEIQTTGTLPV